MNRDLGLFLVRVGFGLLFLLAGFGKLTGFMGPGIAGFAPMVWDQTWLAVVIGAAELLGGLALLLGFWTQWASYGLAIIMVGAIVLTNLGTFSTNAMGFFQNLSTLLALLGLAQTGAGDYSADERYL